jgi:hypothetical protein
MVANPYFQFPLCALSFGQAVDTRLNDIIDYSIVEAGSKLLRKLTAEQQDEFLVARQQMGKIPGGFKSNLWVHRAALYGAKIINVTYNHFGSVMERHLRTATQIADFEKLHGRDAKVRIKSSWLFKARDGHGLTYREFSVLCAIYSAIGDKELAIVTRQRIRHCALGYRTAAIMQAELPGRADKAQPLTERQLRDTITRLHRNKFFARCTVARRITYYSIRLDNEALPKKVLERRTYADFFRASQAAQDQALTTAISQKRSEAAKAEPKPSPAAPRFKFILPGDSN